MGDYLTRVAEAVRDACAAEAFMETTLAGQRVSAACPGEIISNMILNNIDLPAIIASVPRPETVAWIIDWPEEPELGHYLAENPSRYGRSRGLYAEPVAAQVAVPDGLLTAADMKHLQRFAECAEDCDGHDVPKEDMKRLERAGAVRSLGFGRHETTAFGDAMLAATPEAPQVADYEAVIADHARLVRELDVALNGDDAARQASLCDLVAQVKSMTAGDKFELAPPEPPARDDHKSRWNLVRAVNAICDQSPGMDPEEFSRWLTGGGMLELLESGRKWLKLEKEIATLREQNAALVKAVASKERK